MYFFFLSLNWNPFFSLWLLLSCRSWSALIKSQKNPKNPEWDNKELDLNKIQWASTSLSFSQLLSSFLYSSQWLKSLYLFRDFRFSPFPLTDLAPGNSASRFTHCGSFLFGSPLYTPSFIMPPPASPSPFNFKEQLLQKQRSPSVSLFFDPPISFLTSPSSYTA